jgi:hypothetical protein
MHTSVRYAGPGNPQESGDSKVCLVRLIEGSLARGHKKVAAQRIMMLLYRYGCAPTHYVSVLDKILEGCTRREAARIRRNGIQWARLVR